MHVFVLFTGGKDWIFCFYSMWTFKDVQFWGFAFSHVSEVVRTRTGTAEC